MPAHEKVDRALLAALPLPLAQAWRRTLYAETPAAAHERALYSLEAALKYTASVAAAAWMAQGSASDAARSACEALVRPSLGHWAAILRACLSALSEEDPVRGWLKGVLESQVASGAPGFVERKIQGVFDELPAYRNTVSAHGAGLSGSAVAERAPAVVGLARSVLGAMVGERAPVLWGRVGRQRVQLVGPTAVVAVDGKLTAAEPLVLQFDGRILPLSPLWIFDPEEDDVLVLNKGAGLSKVEYLSYGSPRGGSGLLTLKGTAAESMRRLLESLTGHAKLGAADVAALIEEAEVRDLATRATGTRYGPYRVVRKVATGGQGVLYEAVQEDPPRRVALKTLSMEAALVEEAHRRMREEAAALAKVEHPSIVPIYATGETDGVPWIAMKFVDGKSLAEVIESLRGHTGPITVAEWTAAAATAIDCPDAEKRKPHAQRVAELGRDAARALAACHARGLIHRDVKPGNVMIDAAGRVVLTDFGLARPADARSRTFTRKLVGTLQYLAPEALLPARRHGPDARVDVYGLGATLYEALSLHAPFASYGQDEGALLQAVQAKDPLPLRKSAPWVPRELQTIVMKAMEKDRDRRYTSAAALADDLDRYLVGEPIKARPAGPITRARKWVRRHPAKAVGLVTLVCIVLGLGFSLVAATRWQNEMHRRVEQLKRENAADGATLDARVQNGQFADAVKVADRILDRLRAQEDSELAAQHDRLAAKRKRLDQLAQFYRHEEQAWYLAGAEQHDEAEERCALALKSLAIQDHAGWWSYLPAHDLRQDQAEQLEQQVYRVLILYSFLKVKPVVMSPTIAFGYTFASPDEVAKVTEAARAAERVLRQAQGWEQFKSLPPSKSGLLLAKVCQGAINPSKTMPPGPTERIIQPTSPVDYFVFGLIHFSLSNFKRDSAISFFAPIILSKFQNELDYTGAQETAERLLRTSCSLDPRQYWNHFLLGWALFNRGDYQGAELAFGTCVSLQPENPLGYAWRALAVVQQEPKASDVTMKALLKQDLRRRALADSDQSLRCGFDKPSTWWTRADLLDKLNRVNDALEMYSFAAETDIHIQANLSRRQALRVAETYARKQIKAVQDKTDKDSYVTLAQAHAVLALIQLMDQGGEMKVLASVTEALKVPADDPRAASIRAHALAARGSVLLRPAATPKGDLLARKKRYTEALADFAEALRLMPNSALAAFGRASAYERLENSDRALEAYDYLFSRRSTQAQPVPFTEDQRLEAELGRYRVLVKLGRAGEASEAIKEAARLDRRAAKAQQEKLPLR